MKVGTWVTRKVMLCLAIFIVISGMASISTAVPAFAAQVATQISSATYPSAIAVNGAGDIFIANAINNSVDVIPKTAHTLYGYSVTPGQSNLLVSAASPSGLAFDPISSALLIGQSDGQVFALSESAVSVFGVAIPSRIVTPVFTGVDRDFSFDRAGNLFGATSSGVKIMPAASGTLFGQSVTANTLTGMNAASLFSSDFVFGTAVGPQQELYVSIMFSGNTGVFVASAGGGTFFGHTVSPSTFVEVGDCANPSGVDVDSTGNVFFGCWGDGDVKILPVLSGTMFGNVVTANIVSSISALTGMGNQGVTVTSDSSLLISGGYSATFALINETPSGSAPTPSGSASTGSTTASAQAQVVSAENQQEDSLANTGLTWPLYLFGGLLLAAVGVAFYSIPVSQRLNSKAR